MKVSVPGKHATKVVDFPRLDGGLNLWELDYRLPGNQSPEMKNLWWQDGVLQCRDGQTYLYQPETTGKGYTCFHELFWDNAFFHINDKLYRMDMVSVVADGERRTMVQVASGVPENRGTFFRYNDWLFYKNRGGFFKIAYDPEVAELFTVSNVVDDAYVPTILLNADPTTGSGDTYQPENRLSPKKTVKYNAAETQFTKTDTGDGTKTVFSLGKTASADQLVSVEQVYFGSMLVSEVVYTVDTAAGTVTFNTAPEANTLITFVMKLGVTEYQLPVKLIDSVVEVKVNEEVKTVTTDYTVDLAKGLITFKVAPPVSDPPVNNTVEITYSKANPDALEAIMGCPYATVFGGTNAVCMVLGGCEAQPNAFFWSGNDSVSLNPAYWPMSFYNLAGDSEDGITGFGRQYGALIILKERSIGKAAFYVTDIDDRDSIQLTYTAINSKIGCDLPWTIQLIENNIVFCNSVSGVHFIRDSTSALENVVEHISRNINGTEQRPGLLLDTQQVDPDSVCSFDDDNRYWICANGKAYVWDYLLSSWKEPSWFYFTNINGVAFLRNVDKTYHVDAEGNVTQFARIFADYNEAIEKLYQFPAQFFDTYDRLKDVLYVLFAVRSDTDSMVDILYQSDYETREDLTDIRSLSWKLVPRNLAYRILSVQRYAHIAKRKPGCFHVRHFAMRLMNNQIGQDLALVSAQIYFRYSGRDR